MVAPLMKWLPQPSEKDIDDSRNLSKAEIDVGTLVRLSNSLGMLAGFEGSLDMPQVCGPLESRYRLSAAISNASES